MFLGSRAASAPYVVASKIFTVLYFAYFLVVLPALAFLSELMITDLEENRENKEESKDLVTGNLHRPVGALFFGEFLAVGVALLMFNAIQLVYLRYKRNSFLEVLIYIRSSAERMYIGSFFGSLTASAFLGAASDHGIFMFIIFLCSFILVIYLIHFRMRLTGNNENVLWLFAAGTNVSFTAAATLEAVIGNVYNYQCYSAEQILGCITLFLTVITLIINILENASPKKSLTLDQEMLRKMKRERLEYERQRALERAQKKAESDSTKEEPDGPSEGKSDKPKT